MSKGTNRTTIRIPLDLEDAMTCWLGMYNANPGVQTPMDKSDFILKAIAEKLAKIGRGRRKKGVVDVFPADPGMKRETRDDFEESIWGR